MALSANLGSLLAVKEGDIQAFTLGTGVATAGSIWRGGLVAIRLTDGKAYPAVDNIADTYKQFVVGYSLEHPITIGDKIPTIVRVRTNGHFRLKIAGVITAADVGKLACLKDDETVQLYDLAKTKVVVGRIREVIDTTYVYVDLDIHHSRLATGTYD